MELGAVRTYSSAFAAYATAPKAAGTELGMASFMQPAAGQSLQQAQKSTEQVAHNEAMLEERARAKVMQDQFNHVCQTCKNRLYQDGSNDLGVSFKSPASIDPAVAASVVMSHEQEHVSHERAKAQAEGGRVISQTVVLHTGICPECGRTYVAGGTTKTVSAFGGKPSYNDGRQTSDRAFTGIA